MKVFNRKKAIVLNSGAIPNYDLSTVPSEQTMSTWFSGYLANNGFMESGLATEAMGTTGGRQDIGMIPGWCILHLMSQDARMHEVCVGTAYLSGSWPMHYKDEATNLPLSIDNFPYATLMGNPGDAVNPQTGKSEYFSS